jgi:phosphatidylethanolamine/phosphatidyl-N-methylethanolamine N-methyltransferase
MSLPALQKFERQIERQLRLLEAGKTIIERKIERHFRQFELRRDDFGKKLGRKIEETIEQRIKQFERKKGIRFDDEVSFIRSWIERPLSTGAVAPSSKILARTMARYVDPNSSGPVVELGPGTGPVTEALVEAGVDPSRLVLVEFNPTFCRLLRARYPEATLVQGDAYSMRRLLEALLLQPAAAVVSGLPLMTKPIKMRLRLVRDAFELMLPGAPFVQFTYSVASPVPTRLRGFTAEPSERIWMNLPPARVWVYRKA